MAVRKYNADDNFFSDIDSPDKAWCLGLMFSDGYMDRRLLTLSMCDLDVIEKFKKCLKSESPIRMVKKYGNNLQPYSISISSPELYDSLINYGCIPNKSLTLRFPIIHSMLRSHFIRGVFDGDGSIIITGKNRLASVCGTDSMVGGIRNELSDYGIKCSNVHYDKRTRSLKSISVYQMQLPKLWNYLYSGVPHSISMTRKREKLLSYIISL